MRRLIEDAEYQVFKAVWPQRPYWSFFGNYTAIAAWQTVVVPRLHNCFITTAEEWWALAMTSTAANYVGGELARSMAFHAAENSKSLVSTSYQGFDQGNIAQILVGGIKLCRHSVLCYANDHLQVTLLDAIDKVLGLEHMRGRNGDGPYLV